MKRADALRSLPPLLVVLLACSSRAVPEPERIGASDPDVARTESPSSGLRSVAAPPDAGSAPAGDEPLGAGSVQSAARPKPKAVKPAELGQVCASVTPTPDCYAAIPKVAACPERFEDVPEGELCGVRGITTAPLCSYPERRCACEHIEYCGGAYPTFIQERGMRWQCRPLPSPGACPDEPPGPGAACSASKACHYGGCGHGTRCQCSGGRWSCETRHWPRPPSAPPRGPAGPPSAKPLP